MLSALLELALTLLAAVGLAFVLWVMVVRRLLPLSDRYGIIHTVVLGRGSGEGLEQAVRELLWLRRWNLYRGSVLLVDCGLDGEGRDLANLLCANTDEVKLCGEAELDELLH